jgi:hypothetical protein
VFLFSNMSRVRVMSESTIKINLDIFDHEIEVV